MNGRARRSNELSVDMERCRALCVHMRVHMGVVYQGLQGTWRGRGEGKEAKHPTPGTSRDYTRF